MMDRPMAGTVYALPYCQEPSHRRESSYEKAGLALWAVGFRRAVIRSVRVRRKELKPWTGWVVSICRFVPIVLLFARVIMSRLDRHGDQGGEQETWTGYLS